MHPNVSEQVRTGPNRSEQVQTDPKTSKNLKKLPKTFQNCKKLRENSKSGKLLETAVNRARAGGGEAPCTFFFEFRLKTRFSNIFQFRRGTDGFRPLRDRLCLGPRIRRASTILEKRCRFFANTSLQTFKLRRGTVGFGPFWDRLCLAPWIRRTFTILEQ